MIAFSLPKISKTQTPQLFEVSLLRRHNFFLKKRKSKKFIDSPVIFSRNVPCEFEETPNLCILKLIFKDMAIIPFKNFSKIT